jgi:uncharacterized protein (TIGR01777 family)
MNVLIGGGSGLIGEAIRLLLEEQGHRVAVLSRSKQLEGVNTFQWDVEERYIDDEAIRFADAVINLAGTNLAGKRWTLSQKKSIINSRVQSTQLLVTAVERLQKPLLSFVSASAIGYYGSVTKNTVFKESDPPGSDFLGQTCEIWEKAADLFTQMNIRTVKLRIGVVLSEKGGMLKEVLPIFKKSLGAPLGSGKQSVPWVHIEDVARMFAFAVENSELHGAYNATAPNPVTNKAFTRALNRALGKKTRLPHVPGFLLKLLYGGSATLMLDGTPVSSKKIQDAGFKHKYPDIHSALDEIL